MTLDEGQGHSWPLDFVGDFFLDSPAPGADLDLFLGVEGVLRDGEGSAALVTVKL